MTDNREVIQYLQDIAEMMSHIQSFTAGMDFDAFIRDTKTNFAVFRALEVIGRRPSRCQMMCATDTLASRGNVWQVCGID